MGGFYGSIAIRSEDSATIGATLAAMARSSKTRFLVAPPALGWIAVYPSESGQDHRISRRLARRLTADMVHLISHDEDVFCYFIYRGGRLVDQYNSCPDYCAKVSPATRRKQQGRPERYLDLIDGEGVATVRQLLQEDGETRSIYSSQLMARFAALLRLPHETVTSYDYLMEGETEGIARWEEFIHVPDRSQELARKRREAEAVAETTRQLIADGILLVHRSGEQPEGRICNPFACPDRDGRSFLGSLGAGLSGIPVAVERFGPPWSAGSVETGLAVDGGLGRFEPSPSGRYLLIQRGIPGWKTAVWDVEQARLLEAASRDEVYVWSGFMPDESRWVGISQNLIVSTPLEAGQAATVLPLAVGQCSTGAIHPTDPVLVLRGSENRLLLIDLRTGRTINTLLVGGMSETTGMIAMMRLFGEYAEQARAALGGFDMGALQAAAARAQNDRRESYLAGGLDGLLRSPALDLDPLREDREALARLVSFQPILPGLTVPLQSPIAPMFVGAEAPLGLGFDPKGEWLFAATDKGVRAYRWADVMSAIGNTPPPTHSVLPDPYREDTEGAPSPELEIELKYDRRRSVYDLVFDARRGRLLFATMGGQIGFLDPASGQSGVLIEPPGRPPIFRLHLSGDGSKLCCTCHPDRLGRRRQQKKPYLQVWDYGKLATRLGWDESRSTVQGNDSGDHGLTR